jgi:nicotinamidase-related amidase
MKTLIVVDMQNDFIDGSLGTKEAIAIVPKVKAKIKEYLDRGDLVIFTQDTHYEDYLSTQEGKNLPVEHCIFGTDGWKVSKEVDEPTCLHLEKRTFGFRDLPNFVKTEEVELVGLCTGICVLSNAILLKAFDTELKVTVDASCCACVTPESHKTALSAMKLCQVNVINE